MTDEAFIDATLKSLSANPIDEYGVKVNFVAKSFILRLPPGLIDNIHMITLIRTAVVSGSLLSAAEKEKANQLPTHVKIPTLPPVTKLQNPSPPPLPPRAVARK